MEDDELVELDKVLSDLRGNAKLLVKDLIAGIEMVNVASKMMLVIGFSLGGYVLYNLVTLPFYQGSPCCWVLTNYDLAGAIVSIAGIIVAIWGALRVRRKYTTLRVRYSKLVELENALEE